MEIMDFFSFGCGEKRFVILPGLAIHSVMALQNAVESSYKDFAEEYTVYLFERPRVLREGCTVRDLACDTAQAMRELHIENADIFGVSQGGMMAQWIAIDAPELVHSLMLGATLAEPNETFLRVLDTWLHLAEAKDEDALLASFVDNVYSENTLKAYRETMITLGRGITDEEYCRFRILAESCRGMNTVPYLSSIRCPALVLGSEGDRVVTADGTRSLAEKLGCELYMYGAEYGHGVYDEAPDFRMRCMEFLKTLG